MNEACGVPVVRLQMQLWLGMDVQKHASTERPEELRPMVHGNRVSDVLVTSPRLKITKLLGFLVATRKAMNIRSPEERVVVCYLS